MNNIESVWPFSDVPSDAISIYDGPETFSADYVAASPVERDLFAAYWFQAEVLNGGLSQFFSNDTGVLAPEAVTAIRAIGLPDLAESLHRALMWFGSPYPREREDRERMLEDQPTDPFEALDEKVVDLIYDEAGGLEPAALAYARANNGSA